MTLNKNDIGEDKRSCRVWDTGSSNVVTFKHIMWLSVWTLCLYGEALSVRNTSQSWSTAPKLKSHVPTVWLPTATRHVTGSWSWTWGWGGRAGHCQGLRGEDGIAKGRSTAYRGRVAWPEWLLGWSPGRAGVFAWPARVNQNKSYPPPLLTEPLSQSVSRIWLRESLVKPIRSNNPALVWMRSPALAIKRSSTLSLYHPNNSSRRFVSQGEVWERIG